MSSQSTVNCDVLRAWCDAPSHFQPPVGHNVTAQQALAAADSPQRHQYTPAEISQQSVDLLLREYYAMVTTQVHSTAQKGDGPGGMLQQVFLLLLCPAPPRWLQLDRVLKAAVAAVQLTASFVVLSSVVTVPLWLVMLRQVWQQQGPTPAAAAAAVGLVVYLLCDALHRSVARQQAGCVTAATVQQDVAAGSTAELAALRAASKTATTHNSSRPGSTLQQAHAARHQQQQPPAAQHQKEAGSTGGYGSSTASTYAALEHDLASVQATLGVEVNSGHPPGSKEHVSMLLTVLGQQVGMQVTTQMTASPTALGAAVAQLKQHVGV